MNDMQREILLTVLIKYGTNNIDENRFLNVRDEVLRMHGHFTPAKTRCYARDFRDAGYITTHTSISNVSISEKALKELKNEK